MAVTTRSNNAAPEAPDRLETAVSNAVVALFAEYIGRGPAHARTVIDGDLVTVLLNGTLSKAEERLVGQGEGTTVIATRRTFQRTMRKELVEAVEQLLGRRVIAFMSDQHVDPDYAAEVFVLAPEQSPA
jgi:uncharacterized protein YbcI